MVLAARRADRLTEVARQVQDTGRRAVTVATDISDPEQCEAMTRAAVDEFGHVDILINNAGTGTVVPALKERPEDFRRVLDINLNGAYWAAQTCARLIRPRSSIVNVAGALRLIKSYVPQPAYATSKAGLVRSPATSPGRAQDARASWSTPSRRDTSPAR